MSLVPFDAFVVPGGLPGPLLRFPGGPASGLVVRREPTCVHWLPGTSASSSTVGGGGGLALVAGAGAESNTKVRCVRTGSSAPIWYRTRRWLYTSWAAAVCFFLSGHSLAQDWCFPRQLTHWYFVRSSFPRQSFDACPGAAQCPHL